MDYLCISSQVLNVSNAANDLGSQADVHVLIIVHNYVVQNLDFYFQSRYYFYGCVSFLMIKQSKYNWLVVSNILYVP